MFKRLKKPERRDSLPKQSGIRAQSGGGGVCWGLAESSTCSEAGTPTARLLPGVVNID